MSGVLRPQHNRDTAYFWAGTAAGELRLQTCNACAALRHPPGPACPECGALDRGHVVASGDGEIFSWVVHRHPQVPGRQTPFVIALVTLAEGPRVLGELLGVDPDTTDDLIGAAVRIDFQHVDDELTLPVWRLA